MKTTNSKQTITLELPSGTKAGLRALEASVIPTLTRNLKAEQLELLALLLKLPHLKIRQVAVERGMARSTFNSYFAPDTAKSYRTLYKAEDADLLWAILRETAEAIQAALTKPWVNPS